MCYYIGIEDLAANAMIQILEKERQTESSSLVIRFKDLEEYGAEIVRYLNEGTKEKAILILSRASTEYMFRNYSDFFVETEDESAIMLREGRTIEDLKEKFRAYKSVDLIRAYVSEVTAKVLYDKYAGNGI